MHSRRQPPQWLLRISQPQFPLLYNHQSSPSRQHNRTRVTVTVVAAMAAAVAAAKITKIIQEQISE